MREISDWVIVRGGGDIATGVIQKLRRSGLKTLVLETNKPTAIRRTVSLCEAVYDGSAQVEDIRAVLVDSHDDAKLAILNNSVPIIVDPDGESIAKLKPIAVVDAILAKKNIGTRIDMAKAVVALGPGFSCGDDAHAIIETMRGHDLGRLILSGSAAPNTGIPGEIGGKSADRVMHAPAAGVIHSDLSIGDVVQMGDIVYTVGNIPAKAPFTGLLRGMIRNGAVVHKNMKVADIDPRIDVDWNTVSDKARCVGGATLEAVLYLINSSQ